jgi:uncharacterized protein
MSGPHAPWQESALNFECEGTPLWGVVARPHALASSTPAGQTTAHLAQAPQAAPLCSPTGVIIIVGGPQYRVGSHRQFVQTARHLAGQGHSVLRFDYRGMGDSAGETGHFESVSADVRAAIDALLRSQPQVKHVVLWGLCDGASAALLYLHHEQDSRVAGLVLLNPWVRSVTTEAVTRVKHYYVERLKSAAFWRKLLTGQVAATALSELMGSVRLILQGRGARRAAMQAPRTFQERMAAAWRGFDSPVLLVLSGNDHTAREFEEVCAAHPAWNGALRRPTVTRYDAVDADHTFSKNQARRELDVRTSTWLRTNGL